MIRRVFFVALLLGFNLLTYGCAPAIKVSASYPPSILLDGEGMVNVADFSYKPTGFEFDSIQNKFYKRSYRTDQHNQEVEERTYLEPYQFDTKGGLNPVYIDKPLDVFVTEALKKELKFIGYKNSLDSKKIISGEVYEFSIDYIGFSTVDFVARINYTISDETGDIIFKKEITGRYSSSKFTTMEFSSGINTCLAKSIEEFVRSAQGNGVL